MTEIRSMYRPHSRQKPIDDDLAAARGIINGVIITLSVIALAGLLWIVLVAL